MALALWAIRGMVWNMLARVGGIALRDFDSLSQKEILALAISLEERTNAFTPILARA